jgi:hypothetical protein
MLKTETNTKAMYRRVLSAAAKRWPRVRKQADFEHGQWWLTLLDSGYQYSVVDAEGGPAIDGFDFEQVTEGDYE